LGELPCRLNRSLHEHLEQEPNIVEIFTSCVKGMVFEE